MVCGGIVCRGRAVLCGVVLCAVVGGRTTRTVIPLRTVFSARRAPWDGAEADGPTFGLRAAGVILITGKYTGGRVSRHALRVSFSFPRTTRAPQRQVGLSSVVWGLWSVCWGVVGLVCAVWV